MEVIRRKVLPKEKIKIENWLKYTAEGEDNEIDEWDIQSYCCSDCNATFTEEKTYSDHRFMKHQKIEAHRDARGLTMPKSPIIEKILINPTKRFQVDRKSRITKYTEKQALEMLEEKKKQGLLYIEVEEK